MSPERWRQIEGVLQEALERGPGERAAFLEHACAGDAPLRAEVESLLRSEEPARSFLGSGALEDATALLGDPEPDSLVGRDFGHYSVEARLGAGGMGEVYLARDGRLGRRVALKLLDPVLASDPAARARFLREARLAAALDHPNVCAVHEVGEAEGRPFIAMQYVEGQTLKQVIGGRPLKVAKLLPIAIQVAEALAAAHERGIVHRDVKPGNIIVTPEGRAKVLDFGIAKLLEKGAGGEGADVTATGQLLGTPSAMSPEQARGLAMDARTDVWSLGVVLYEMLTGRAPFAGETVGDVIASILRAEPTPPSQFAPDVPAALERVVTRALRKDPDERYQAVGQMLADLREVRREAEVRELIESSAAGGPAAYTTRGQERVGAPRRLLGSPARRVAAALAVAAVLLLAFAAYKLQRQPRQSDAAAARPAIKSIAVLPFKPLVPGQRDEALEMGVADTLITRLSNVRGVDVRPINAVRRYAAPEQDPLAAGREQKVDAVLDGSIQKAGERIRVSARLVAVADGATLWADTFDDKFTDIFAVEDSIAERVTATLAVRLSGDERALVAKHYTENPEAYQLYLRGRYFWNKRTGDAIRKSVEYFDGAVKIDPDYALAYAGLAESYVLLANYAGSTPQEAYSKARAAAAEALRLNDGLAQAHSALAYIKAAHDWDFAGAEREYRRAIELNPNYATAHHWYGEFLALMGRADEGVAELRRAQELEPLSLIVNTVLGNCLFFAGRYDEALEMFRKTLDLDPNFSRARIQLGYVYRQKGMHAEAIAEFQKALALDADDTYALSQLGYTYAVLGRGGEAREIIERLKQRAKRKYVLPADVAIIYAGLGDKEEAFYWLEKAYEHRDENLLYLKVDPPWDGLRSDPRFLNLLRRVGLPQ